MILTIEQAIYQIISMRVNFPKHHMFIPRQFRPHITHPSPSSNSSKNTWESSISTSQKPSSPTPVPPAPQINPEYETDSKDSIELDKDKGKNVYATYMARQFLAQMQALNYDGDPSQLMDNFKDILSGHVTIDGVYPVKGLSDLGEKLMRNGLFHEMWAKVVVKNHMHIENWLYYQKYIGIISTNLSNFESTFNRQPSTIDPTKHSIKNLQEDSNTNLRKIPKIQPSIPPAKVKHTVEPESSFQQSRHDFKSFDRSVNISSKQNDPPLENKGVQFDFDGRLRLFGQVQTNKRRLDAEMVCVFLKITKVYRFEDIDISSVLEYYFTDKLQLVVLEAHIPVFHPEFGRKMIDYRPKIFLIHYGDVNFSGLLRLKMTYNIEGLVVYDEIFKIKLQLENHGLIEKETSI